MFTTLLTLLMYLVDNLLSTRLLTYCMETDFPRKWASRLFLNYYRTPLCVGFFLFRHGKFLKLDMSDERKQEK